MFTRSSQSTMTPSSLFLALLLLAPFLFKGLWVNGSPGCASCALPAMEKDAQERLMIEIAKKQILDKLHLQERPNISHTVPRAALLTALRKLHTGRVRQDGTVELENHVPTKDQGYEIVSFADISKCSPVVLRCKAVLFAVTTNVCFVRLTRQCVKCAPNGASGSVCFVALFRVVLRRWKLGES